MVKGERWRLHFPNTLFTVLHTSLSLTSCHYRQGSYFANIITIQAYEYKDAVLLLADLLLIPISQLVAEAVYLGSYLSQCLPAKGRIERPSLKMAKVASAYILPTLSPRKLEPFALRKFTKRQNVSHKPVNPNKTCALCSIYIYIYI